MNVALIDNYDSFTHNIAHIIRNSNMANLQIIEAGESDKIDLDVFDGIVFSPGPDLPRPGSAMEKILVKHSGHIPLLGICLGLQAIWVYFGGSLMRLDTVMHGRSTVINTTGKQSLLFKGIPGTFTAGLYHSWCADPLSKPDNIEITAVSEERTIMAIRHNSHPIEAVQFHPESILTPFGNKMLLNWIEGIKR
jgi:anthranilate synthase component 2